MAEDVGVGATAFFQGVGQHGEVVWGEGPFRPEVVLRGGLGQLRHRAVIPPVPRPGHLQAHP
jgi:hypothetical protein